MERTTEADWDLGPEPSLHPVQVVIQLADERSEGPRRNTVAYTKNIPSVSVLGVLAPTSRHLPPSLGIVLGTDQKILNFDVGWRSVARILEKLAHMGLRTLPVVTLSWLLVVPQISMDRTWLPPMGSNPSTTIRATYLIRLRAHLPSRRCTATTETRPSSAF